MDKPPHQLAIDRSLSATHLHLIAASHATQMATNNLALGTTTDAQITPLRTSALTQILIDLENLQHHADELHTLLADRLSKWAATTSLRP